MSALQPSSRPPLAAGDRVLVTGANGFIGSSVARALLAEGCSVMAMIEPRGAAGTSPERSLPTRNLEAMDVERVECDLRDRDRVREVVKGCRAVFHVAAIYRFWARDPKLFYDVNVGGTRNVLDAAAAGGVERVVYTSTVGTLGVDGPDAGKGVDETSYPDLSHLFGSYKRSKYVAEHEVLRAAATGLPVTIVMPTFPLGPGDSAPTPTGKVVLDFINGKLPGYVDTILNVVHVDDVGRGHLLAFNHGGQGRSYILGGENLSMKQLLDVLAAFTGQKTPSLRVPTRVARSVAWISESVEGRVLGRHPTVPLEAARMSSTKMAFDDSRARVELGYTSRPPNQAIEDSVRWFIDNGYSPRSTVPDPSRTRDTRRAMDVNAPDEPRATVVLLHPHPAMGGNRYHPFIDGLFHRLADRGLAAVRFDFSSADMVTASDEAVAAIDEAARTWPRIRVVVAGYSFGSSVAVRIDDERVIGWFLLAPQAPALVGARIGTEPRPKMIVVPEHDQFSPPEAVEASVGDWISTSVSVAPGADHFLGDVGPIVDRALEWVDLLVG